MSEPTKAPTKLAYYVHTFNTPDDDSFTSFYVNKKLDQVRELASHLGEVRVVSLSKNLVNPFSTRTECVLTIEYTRYA